ncbi:MAG: formate dehydrogenase accessory sulfurtransferase FdhD [Acidobacteria bacterium]|nr:formate dehydrogenase accessory sulfurtransferase FdhD [Acidobacteriota bacterium]
MRRQRSSIDLTSVCEWQDARVRRFLDYLAREEPLEIRVGNHPLCVTMRTPGHDLELATGFLVTEGLIQRRDQIADLRQGIDEKGQELGNVVQIELAGVEIDRARMQRNFFATSSCGICGKASIEAVRVRGIGCPNQSLRVDAEVLYGLPDKLRAAQTIFGRTGGLHAAGIFDTSGELIALREDVGRHNAVDKVVGWALLQGRLPLAHHLLMVSGRGGFEIVQKALVAGFPLLACVSAPSSLAVQSARQLGLTLVGFLRGKRFLVYAGEERILQDVEPSISSPGKSKEILSFQ